MVLLIVGSWLVLLGAWLVVRVWVTRERAELDLARVLGPDAVRWQRARKAGGAR